jgi:hypothetical protein
VTNGYTKKPEICEIWTTRLRNKDSVMVENLTELLTWLKNYQGRSGLLGADAAKILPPVTNQVGLVAASFGLPPKLLLGSDEAQLVPNADQPVVLGGYCATCGGEGGQHRRGCTSTTSKKEE